MAEKSRKSLADSLLKSVKKATRKDETVDSSKPSKSLVDKPKYTQGQGLGDVELRADLEAYMYGNPLARLGYELYKEGKINIKGIDRLIMPGMLTTPATAKEFGLGDKTTLLYRTEPGSGQHMEKRPYGPLREIQQVENEMAEANIDPLKVIIHELTHAGFSALEEKTGKKVGVEEGIVRAGDELITARTTGRPGTLGGPGLKNLLGGSNIPFTPNNEKILKERYLKYSLQAQDLLNEKGIPQEAIAPSDNRNPAFISKTFKELLGFEKERNKLNHLGFARPLEDYYLGLPTKQHGALYTKDVSSFGDSAIKKGTLDPSRADLMVEGPTYLPRNKKIKMQEGGALMALQEQAGLGTSPMTQKTSPPVGNKKQKVEKMPKRGAAPKVVDPRDEVMKLVAKKLKQDKTNVGIATPTAPMPTAMPSPMTTALAAPQIPAKKAEEEQLLSSTPIKAAKGKSIEDAGKSKKKGKGLAVVIDMGSTEKPEYEEASMGTPSDPPPGATADEVKDNQHVLLSEGELVVPANVVRYHGLGMYEGLRRDALQGLGEMEDAGQVEYIDNEVKTAAAGMTIMNAQPNVATLGGIQKQQATYNPALGQYGTAAAPEAASAKFVSTGFIDRNKDGIDDKLQPSVKKTPVTTTAAPTSITTSPAGLALGPTTDANTVVGAGNVGSYISKQSGVPGSGDDEGTPVDNTIPPVAPTRVVQQQQDSGDDGGDPEIAAGLGGARATIGGQEYALQYDFNGNVTGIANVADALTSGRANFIAPNPELAMDLLNMTKGQINMLSGGLYGKMAGTDIQNRQQTIALAEKIKAGNYGGLGMRPQDMPMPRPDGLGTSTMPRVETAPVSPVNRQLAFGLGENLGGSFGTTDVDYNPNTMVEGLLRPEAPKVDITNLGSIDGPANEAARASKMGIDGPAITPTQPFQQAYDYSDDMLPDRLQQPQQPFFGGGIDGPADAAASRVGIDGPASAAALQSKQMFGPDRYAYDYNDDMLPDRPTANLSGVGGAISSEAQQARDQAFREEAEAKSRKEARDAQMRGIGLGLSAAASAPGTSTNDALQGKGYSSYDSQGNPSGAAPAGSQYSATGTFSTSRTDDDNDNDLGGGSGAGYGSGTGEGGTQTSEETKVDPTAGQDLSRTFADDAATSDTGGGKIVCTEMYRQTQLDDWAQAMKTWHIYQKKYLTPIHEIGYHSLFKPFVRGMKVNKALTNLGAYLAEERTKHLRHILTKGKARDSIVGNIFCKIIHPIVYLVGLAVHKK